MKPGEIVIKNDSVLRGLMERTYAPLLINIILEIVDVYGIRMSESWRLPRHSGDLHSTSPVRAIDISFWVYSEKIAHEIERKVNNKWVYDTERPKMKVVYLHKTKKGVFHFHIQVHGRTRLRVLYNEEK